LLTLSSSVGVHPLPSLSALLPFLLQVQLLHVVTNPAADLSSARELAHPLLCSPPTLAPRSHLLHSNTASHTARTPKWPRIREGRLLGQAAPFKATLRKSWNLPRHLRPTCTLSPPPSLHHQYDSPLNDSPSPKQSKRFSLRLALRHCGKKCPSERNRYWRRHKWRAECSVHSLSIY
jgi:hypothetical protein